MLQLYRSKIEAQQKQISKQETIIQQQERMIQRLVPQLRELSKLNHKLNIDNQVLASQVHALQSHTLDVSVPTAQRMQTEVDASPIMTNCGQDLSTSPCQTVSSTSSEEHRGSSPSTSTLRSSISSGSSSTSEKVAADDSIEVLLASCTVHQTPRRLPSRWSRPAQSLKEPSLNTKMRRVNANGTWTEWTKGMTPPLRGQKKQAANMSALGSMPMASVSSSTMIVSPEKDSDLTLPLLERLEARLLSDINRLSPTQSSDESPGHDGGRAPERPDEVAPRHARQISLGLRNARNQDISYKEPSLKTKMRNPFT